MRAAPLILTLFLASSASARESRPLAKKLNLLERRRDISTLRNVLAYHEGEIHLQKLAPDLSISFSGRYGFRAYLKRNGGLTRRPLSDPSLASRPEIRRLDVEAIEARLANEAARYTDGPAPRHWKRSHMEWLEIERGLY